MNACVMVNLIVSNRGKLGLPRVLACSAARGRQLERLIDGERRRARPSFHRLRGSAVGGRLLVVCEGPGRRPASPQAAGLRGVGGPMGKAAPPRAAGWLGKGVGGVRGRRADAAPAAIWRVAEVSGVQVKEPPPPRPPGGGVGGARWGGPPSRRRPGGKAGGVCGAGPPFSLADGWRVAGGPWARAASSPAAGRRVAGWVGLGNWQGRNCASIYCRLPEPVRVLPCLTS